jgi:hypothetical protein
MTLQECRKRIAAEGIPKEPVFPGETPIRDCAVEAAVMVRSYLDDGDRFSTSGDLKNGLASYSYAMGWHDAACFYGLFSPGTVPDQELTGCFRDVPCDEGMVKKREKYEEMLARALDHVRPAPDPGSCLFPWADKIVETARRAWDEGNLAVQSGSQTVALFWYSYGHGWLDFGVRSGSLAITGDRELFAI